MSKPSKDMLDELTSNWGSEFPGVTLTAKHFKEPHLFMSSVFLVLDRLGIDREVITAPPPEEEQDEHTPYYWDLLPVINMIRVINRLICITPHSNVKINMLDFLQPSINKSISILLVLFNLMIFYDERRREIAPNEQKLFAMKDEVKSLKDQKHRLLEMLNEQAEEKAKRVDRLEKLNIEIKQMEEDLHNENEAFAIEKQETDDLMKESRQMETLYEQKKAQKDALLAEIAQKTALKVSDADDIHAQVEQAKKKVAEADENINTLKDTLLQKENSLKNLQTVKTVLDTCNNFVHELLENINNADPDNESNDEYIKVLEAELSEEQEQLSETRRLKEEAVQTEKEDDIKIKIEMQQIENSIQEATEQKKQMEEKYATCLQRCEELKSATSKFAEDKQKLMEELHTIRETYKAQCAAMQDTLINKLLEAEKVVIEKLGGISD